jgi:hypothetical protein
MFIFFSGSGVVARGQTGRHVEPDRHILATFVWGEVTLQLTVNQSVYLGTEHITSCRNVAVWNLRYCICGAPSQTRGRVCSLQSRSESRRTRSYTLQSHLKLPQPGGPGSRIYIPQEQGGPVIPPGTGFSLENSLKKFVILLYFYCSSCAEV